MAKKTINFRDAVVTIEDNTTPTANSFTIVLDEGDLTFDVPNDEVIMVSDRGQIDHVRKGSQRTISLSMTGKHIPLTAGTGDTLWDVINGDGTSWDHSAVTGAGYDLNDNCDVDVVQIKVTYNTATGSESDVYEEIEFPNCRLPEVSFREGNEYNTLALSTISYQNKPIITRTAS